MGFSWEQDFGWNTVGMLYHDFKAGRKGHSLCYLTMAAIYNVLLLKKPAVSQSKQNQQNFDEDLAGKEDFIDILKIMSKHARSE